MTDLLIQSASSSPPPRSDSFRYGLREGCRSPVIARYTGFEDRPSGLGLSDLKHSKSDDLVLQSAPATAGEMHHGISDASIQIQKEACVVYEDDLAVPTSVLPKSLPVYYSDSETSNVPKCSSIEKPVLKITGDFGAEGPSRRSSRHIGIYDRLDPEDSIRDIISENDFYRFVLFKRHYEKYLDISQKYEEARNLAYYLEEKYHEIKAERDRLARKQQELERRMEGRDNELHDKEEELFLQLEKAIRLEEDCEKLRTEKERMLEWKDRLEREKNEAYRQLKLQADESEHTRRRLERARNDVVRQVTAIVAEKDSLERENLRLKEALDDIERKSHRSGRSTHSVHGLEKEVYDLKQVAKQSATLNSQLKKGMKHLATCRRRKCSVCAYTRATFGEYAASDGGSKKLFSCFVDTRKRSRSAQGRHSSTWSDTDGLADRLSELSVAPPSPSEYCPSPLPLKHISYIDEGSDSSSEDEREEERGYAQTDASTTSSAPHAFSSDSGFSSDTPASQRPSLHRATRWTSSFRRLIRRVSKRQLNNTT